jgi:transposase-like protein
MTNGSWRVDETYIRVKGRWVYLDRVVDAAGQTIDVLLSPKRDAAAARRFFRKALTQSPPVNPRTLTVDNNAADPIAMSAMTKEGTLWRFANLRPVKFLNTSVEPDHRRIQRLVRPGPGFKTFRSAAPTIAGCEVMAMIRKGQVVSAPVNDMGAQRAFMAPLFGDAASPASQPGRRLTHVRRCNGATGRGWVGIVIASPASRIRFRTALARKLDFQPIGRAAWSVARRDPFRDDAPGLRAQARREQPWFSAKVTLFARAAS